MSLRIAQDFEYKGSDWWTWSVWIEGTASQELNQVDYVEYTLHPTFPKPVRIVRDRTSGFRLDSAGWGVFTIYARAVLTDGSETLLEHELELLYQDGRPTTS